MCIFRRMELTYLEERKENPNRERRKTSFFKYLEEANVSKHHKGNLERPILQGT